MRKASARQLELPFEFRRSVAIAPAHICFGPRVVSYTVRRSRRRRGAFSLAIDERGLRVGVPWNATQRTIEQELRKHERWIVRKLEEWEARRVPCIRWEDGATLLVLGKPVSIRLAANLRGPVCAGPQLALPVAASAGSDAIARAAMAALRDQALRCFAARLARYAPKIGVAIPRLRLSQARTRWGSCHPNGHILLNWRLIQMPLRLIDYVVVHELAHLREMNHSPRFWRIVAGILPEYAAHRAEIRLEAHRYLLV